MKKYFLLPLGVLPLFFASCGHIVHTEQNYAPSVGSSGAASQAVVNGATVGAELIPTKAQGTFGLSAMVYFAGGEVTKGPYKFLLIAQGKEGSFRNMIVHHMKIRTDSGRTEGVPSSYLGGRRDFNAVSGMPGVAQAVYFMPGDIDLKFKKDGNVYIDADVTIATTSRSQRRQITLTMSPDSKRKVEFASVIGEIMKSRKKNTGNEPWE